MQMPAPRVRRVNERLVTASEQVERVLENLNVENAEQICLVCRQIDILLQTFGNDPKGGQLPEATANFFANIGLASKLLQSWKNNILLTFIYLLFVILCLFFAQNQNERQRVRQQQRDLIF